MPLIASFAHDRVPFVAAGVLNIVDDLSLLVGFRSVAVDPDVKVVVGGTLRIR